ncbi:SDR family oxidoreductase [Microbacterium deminutum]
MQDARLRAVVTGARRGIGAATAERLLREGWLVDSLGRQPPTDWVRMEGDASRFLTADISSSADMRRVAAEYSTTALDLLVANAAEFAPWDEVASHADLDSVDHLLAVNVIGTWRTLQTFLPALRRADAAVVIIVGSGGGSHGDPQFGIPVNAGAASYAVSKAAVHALAVKAHVELAPEGIGVYVVDPGLTDTSPGMARFGARRCGRSSTRSCPVRTSATRASRHGFAALLFTIAAPRTGSGPTVERG